MNMPEINAVFFRNALNFWIDLIFADPLTWIITFIVIMIIFMLSMSYFLNLDDKVYAIGIVGIKTFLLFSAIIMLDRGLIPFPG